MKDPYNSRKLIAEAMTYYGLTEVDGPESNPIILDMIKRLFPHATDDSKIAWCSIFIHAVCDAVGIYIPLHATSGMARSWLKEGNEVQLEEAVPGDIVVFWRQSVTSPYGHVAFFVNDRGNGTIRVLGGNQENAVNIRSYDKSRVLGVRRL